jgi:hypothetical protein
VAAHGDQLLNEISAIPGVAIASRGFLAPATEGGAFTNLSYNNGKEELKPNTQIRWGDPNFIKVYQMKLLAGRNVLPSDSIKEFLVNESYAHAIGFINAADVLNQTLNYNGKNIPVVGVNKRLALSSLSKSRSGLLFSVATRDRSITLNWHRTTRVAQIGGILLMISGRHMRRSTLLKILSMLSLTTQ